jgi:hypothetical protein
MPCPECTSRVREDRLARHLINCHRVTGVTNATEQSKSTEIGDAPQNPPTQHLKAGTGTVAPKRHLVQCLKCKSFLRESRLARHLRKQHGFADEATIKPFAEAKSAGPTGRSQKSASRRTAITRPEFSTSKSSGRYSVILDEDDDAPEADLDDYYEDRRLDGSRDYWQFREDGQFGSHPTYDDFGDESEP